MRAAGIAGALVLAGCIGTNPRWNRPDGSVATVADDGTETTAAGTDTDDGESSTTGDDRPEATSSDASATSSDDGDGPVATNDDGAEDGGGAPACPPEQQLCAGICAEIDHDKHACGSDCVDCTPLYGNNARCVHGACAPHGDGGDGD